MGYNEQQLDGLRAHAKSMEEFVDTVMLHDDDGLYMLEKHEAMTDRANKIYKGEISPEYSEMTFFGIWMNYHLMMKSRRRKARTLTYCLLAFSFLCLTIGDDGDIVYLYSIGLVGMLCTPVLLLMTKFHPLTEVKEERNNEIIKVNAIYQTPLSNEPSRQRTVTFSVPPQSN